MRESHKNGENIPCLGRVLDITDWAVQNLEMPKMSGQLIYLKEWRSLDGRARGWLARWGDPGISCSGGGVRMRAGATPQEALYLASTMYEKFGISGPEVNGSKFVIDYDIGLPDKKDVLANFLQAFLPDLQNIGTAGDLGVSEEEVTQTLSRFGIKHPQEGMLRELGVLNNEERLLNLAHTSLSEQIGPKHRFLIDVTAGWSTFIAIKSFLEHNGVPLKGQSVTIHGVGAVGGSAGYYLEREGAKIVAVADINGTVETKNSEFCNLLKKIDPITGTLIREAPLRNIGLPEEVLYYPSDILVLAATSEVITTGNSDRIVTPILAEGANHPITKTAELDLQERSVSILPDFIVNAGTAEFFSIAMLSKDNLSQQEVLEKIRLITDQATRATIRISQEEALTLRDAARKVSDLKLWRQVV